jgi:putative transposase
MNRKSYPSDLSDLEWSIIKPLLPPVKNRGRKRETDLREIVNAILYLLNEGCKWRSLPHDFPHWSTVRTYFDKWNKNRIWYQINRRLREELRQQEGRETQPSAGAIDSQSVKTTEKRGRYTALTVAKKSKVRNAPPGKLLNSIQENLAVESVIY